ncbi:MAG TPA: TonB-dependent receptor [Gemmatimonadaceae bacterium]|jgi:iron complex outermembrane receptor protein
MKVIILVAAATACAVAVGAQVPTAPPTPPDTAKIGAVKVVAPRAPESPVTPLQSLTLPAAASVTAQKAQETINVVDAEDAVKYLPSVFLRKRNYGDTQATIGTRSWGVSSSARSLVFADGVPLTALVANNNTIGGPRWGLVPPIEISRIDMMYGPYSAAYAGNSMGAVMEITTRMPDKFEGEIDQTEALQRFDLYGTRDTYGTAQTAAVVGDRLGKFSYWASGNYQNSNSQPLLFVTSPTFPNGTTGGYSAQNRTGATANVLGASGLLHTGMTNATAKIAYDITPSLRAAYTFAFWQNDAKSSVQAYTSAAGEPTFAGQSGYASGFYDLNEDHTAHSLSLRTNTHRDWDFEAVGSLYDFNKDQQRTPTTVSSSGTTFGAPGRVAVLNGTGWSTVDAKAAWHPGGAVAPNIVSFGAHYDHYVLNNPTYTTPDWRSNGNYTSVATEGDGKTRTEALWAQDAWRITPFVELTVGGRYEDWRAFDGYNANGSTTVHQPVETSSKFSPKAVLGWTSIPDWKVTASVAKAYRFATASELYQLVSTGATFTSPDPNLKPDNDLSGEFRVERLFPHGSTQVSLFEDDVHDAIISQYLPLVAGSSTLYSYLSNVDHIRMRGVEWTGTTRDVALTGLEFSGSVTYLDARTLALSGRASATAAPGTAVGKQVPNVPEWRGTFVTTYKFNPRVALSAAGRYSSKVYSTLDNSDVNFNTYQGFGDWFVMDAHANYVIDRHLTASLGIDNLLDRKYFLYHPFPQRTFVADLKYGF